jgi:hypothetical protein
MYCRKRRITNQGKRQGMDQAAWYQLTLDP